MDSTATTLHGKLLQITQIELVTPTTVAGTLYGIAFTLFCLYVHALAPRLRKGDRTKQAKFMLVYSTVIMLCGLYCLISNAWIIQDAYIKHSDYPGGPYVHIEASYLTSAMIPVGLACQWAVDVLTSSIQIWRVWVIWSATGYAYLVIVLPALCFLASTVLKLRTIILNTTLPLAENVRLDGKTGRAEIAIQGATTILCTLLISLYLIFKHWEQRKLIGKSQGAAGYTNVVAMIVESYVLESVWLLAMAITLGQVAYNFFGECITDIEIIAYLLVQYRVARGNGYESHRERQNMSSLRWNHSNHATTHFEGDDRDEDGLHVSAKPEAPAGSRISSMA